MYSAIKSEDTEACEDTGRIVPGELHVENLICLLVKIQCLFRCYGVLHALHMTKQTYWTLYWSFLDCRFQLSSAHVLSSFVVKLDYVACHWRSQFIGLSLYSFQRQRGLFRTLVDRIRLWFPLSSMITAYSLKYCGFNAPPCMYACDVVWWRRCMRSRRQSSSWEPSCVRWKTCCNTCCVPRCHWNTIWPSRTTASTSTVRHRGRRDVTLEHDQTVKNNSIYVDRETSRTSRCHTGTRSDR